MRSPLPPVFMCCTPSNYGAAAAHTRCGWYRAAVVALAGLVLMSAGRKALAQQASHAGFDTRQAEKFFDAQQPRATAAPPPRIADAPRPAAPGQGKPLFVLRSVALSGATAIPPAELAPLYQAYLGRPVSQDDLGAIAAAITAHYRAADYHLSRAIVPPQDIRDGRVRIEVVEGAIAEVALRGEGAEEFGVRPMLAPVIAEQPSRLATLERQLLLINGRGGVRIADSALEEIGGTTGRFRLVLTLKTWHVYTALGSDNLGSSTVGPWQTYATAAFNSYLVPGDTLAANLSTTPGDPRELSFGRLAYDMPVGADGARIGASALYSEVRPGDFRRLYNDNTVTEAFEIHGSVVPLRSQRASLVLTAAAAFSDVAERSSFGTLYHDHIRTLALTADYRWKDDVGGDSYLTVAVRQGLSIFGASPADSDFVSRAGAAPGFSVVNAWFKRDQTLSDAWSIRLAAAGQAASGPLYTSQQFYLGGYAFGRGYGSAEVSGDNGLAGTFELRFDQKPDWTYLASYQLYGFVDAGVAWNDGFRPGDGITLTSAGAGVRFNFADDWRADFGVAVPLGYRAPDNTTRSPRFLISLSSAFKSCPQRGHGHCL
jgi:hemolysin activation/secretion protein